MRQRPPARGRPQKAVKKAAKRPAAKKPRVPAAKTAPPKAARKASDPALTRLRAKLRAAEAERDASQEAQQAMAEVLGLIASAPAQLDTIFAAILDHALRLCAADTGNLYRQEGDGLRAVAVRAPPELERWMRANLTIYRPTPDRTSTRAMQRGVALQLPDLRAAASYAARDPQVVAAVELGGVRTILHVPVTNGREVLGLIMIYRREVRAFTDKQVALVESFAKQAAIAIENARVLTELRTRTGDLQESLDYQTAIGDVLKVISRSAVDLDAVLETVVTSAVRLCQAEYAVIFRNDGGEYRWAAGYGLLPEYDRVERDVRIRPGAGTVVGRAALEGRTVQIADAWADPLYEDKEHARAGNVRAMLGVPLLREGTVIGVIGLARSTVTPYSEREVQLVTTFADQAVIAIENARLLTELRESLDRQTATADILRVIAATPSDPTHALGTIAATAARMFDASSAGIRRLEGGMLRYIAISGPEAIAVRETMPDMPLDSNYQSARSARENRQFQGDSGTFLILGEMRRQGREVSPGSVAFTPLARDGEAIGVMSVIRRELRPFSDTELELMRGFAAQAVIAIENARLLTELRESLDRQTATSEVLRVISSSPGELQPVFQTMLENAVTICAAGQGLLVRYDGAAFTLAAQVGFTAAFLEFLSAGGNADPRTGIGRMLATKATIHIADITAEPVFAEGDPLRRATAELGKVRTALFVPLLKDGAIIGAILLSRQEVWPFTDKQIELVEGFAAQAVIAIENARLLIELRDSLDRQTATSEVLGVIASSPGELRPVFAAMLANAMRLCEAQCGFIYRLDGREIIPVADQGVPPAYAEYRRNRPHTAGPGTMVERMLAAKQSIHVEDARLSESYRSGNPNAVAGVELAGARTNLYVPLLKDGAVIGVINLFRQEVRPFTNSQIALVENFAAQAVIAIENARLLSELRESLDRQTATSDILRVIASTPGDPTRALDTIAETAARMFAAGSVGIRRVEGNVLRYIASAGPYARALREAMPDVPLDAVITSSRCVIENRQISVDDITELDTPVERWNRQIPQNLQSRSCAFTPLTREGEAIGMMAVNRTELRPFRPDELELMRGFADQAVIAIENARLLTELRESLDRQTATAEVLGVISASPGTLEPVFDAMLANAMRLCEARSGFIFVRGDDGFETAADLGVPSAAAAYRRSHPPKGGPGTMLHEMLATKKPVHVHDAKQSDAYRQRIASAIPAIDLGAMGTVLYVPMLKDDAVIGAINVWRQEVRPFAGDQIALVENFAKQAVIAIENARLLSELRESLDRQTATSEVLSVISASPGNVEPVFDSILDNALRLCGCALGLVFRLDGDALHIIAGRGARPDYLAYLRELRGWRFSPDGPLARAIAQQRAVEVADLSTSAPYIARDPIAVQAVEHEGARSLFWVPMVREGTVLGVIGLYRREVRPFDQRDVDIVANFANQAAIAIENARLLGELRESLDRQTATAEVLQAINSSPGDLRGVFDAMLEKAMTLCEANLGMLYRFENETIFPLAIRGVVPGQEGVYSQVVAIEPESVIGGLARSAEDFVHIADIVDTDTYRAGVASRVRLVQATGARTALWVALRKDGALIGVFVIYRREVRPFSEKQIELVENFAAQAVIAIENARLLTELRESLDRQTATSEVLGVISASPGELQPVFDTMLANATRICEADRGSLFRREGNRLVRAAYRDLPSDLVELRSREDLTLESDGGRAPERMMREKATIHIPDYQTDDWYRERHGTARVMTLGDARTGLWVPMLKDGEVVGAFSLLRVQPRPFSEKQIALVENFAKQAVIAIENARLLGELRESLDRQTATADILRVIASTPGDPTRALNAIAETAARMFDASSVTVRRLANGMLDAIASAGPVAQKMRAHQPPFAIDSEHHPAQCARENRQIHIEDMTNANVGGSPSAVGLAREFGIRTSAFTPLTQDGRGVGVMIVNRSEVRPFRTDELELMRGFADQAVIAIENARLLTELRESLDRQTATSDILRVIASTPGDPTRALDTIAETAMRMFDAANVAIRRREGTMLRAFGGAGPIAAEHLRRVTEVPLDATGFVGTCIRENRQIQIPDLQTEELPASAPARMGQSAGVRTCVYTPLAKAGEAIGAMAIWRNEVRTFRENELELMRGFADQAVIAIENARLLGELRARTDELARSVGELKALGDVIQAVNSTLDFETVLTAIVANAARLSRTEAGAIYVFDGGTGDYRPRATHGMDARMIEAISGQHAATGAAAIRDATAGRVPMQIADLTEQPKNALIDLIVEQGFRAVLVIPLLRPDRALGALVVRRRAPGEFAPATIELLETFAAQSVVAIQNARLFAEIEETGRELAEASRHKSQFLANMSHELRTPLNAILGYTELIIDEVYGATPPRMREVLARVESNGRHLLGLINDVLDLSKIEAGQLVLSMAPYSVKQLVQSVYAAVEPLATSKGLALTLEVAPDLPAAKGDERRLAQVLLNLVGNAIKFTDRGVVSIGAAGADGTLTLSVTDTGPGIAPGDQAKIFEEFQQADNSITKAKGGTGLGLAISKRIVELHGGRIWVESEPGRGSNFAFSVPVTVERAAGTG